MRRMLFALLTFAFPALAGSLFHWEPGTPAGKSRLSSVAYGAGAYVAVGPGYNVQYSTDAATWIDRSAGVAVQNSKVVYIDGVFMTMGGFGRSAYSLDGKNWTTLDYNSLLVLRDVALGDSGWVMVGAEDTAYHLGGIFTSKDGKVWTAINKAMTEIPWSVAFGNGVYAWVGNRGHIQVSRNGVDWTAHNFLARTQALRSLTFAAGLFVAVGDSGTILTSSDGMDWTQRESASDDNLRSVSYDGSRFLTVGSGTKLHYSMDGISWATEDIPQRFNGIGFGAGRHILVGDSGMVAVAQDSGPSASLQGTAPRAAVSEGAAAGRIRLPESFHTASTVILVRDLQGALLARLEPGSGLPPGLVTGTCILEFQDGPRRSVALFTMLP